MKKVNFKKCLKVLAVTLSCLVLFIALVAFFAAKWYHKTYGDIGFDSILFTLLNDVGAVDKSIINSYLTDSLAPSLIIAFVVCFILFFNIKKKFGFRIKDKFKIVLYPFNRVFSIIVSLILSVVLILNAAKTVKLDDYLEYVTQETPVFEEEYVDPQNAKITFPEQKRNLIYIFVESMETTFMSKDLGGELDNNLLPNLYNLANENVNFSHNDGVGGFSQVSGSTYTAGAMVTQTSGIPLKTFYEAGNTYGKDNFLPGVYTLNDLLKENGYYQTLMVGSDATYGHRDQYFVQHGIDKIYDYYTAKEDKIIEEDYYVWWGFEDEYLYKYAKQELLEISKKQEPFAFTMLTVDTHFPNGYVCNQCGGEHPQQYDNVLKCADRQLFDFVNWIKAQDFYENTTIVVAGDHLTMDKEYIRNNVENEDNRYIYNCIINSAVATKNSKNRQFLGVDMMPTTLAAMGCEIEGDRLGLGTNLFSDKKTLTERKGMDYLLEEMPKFSNYYLENFSQ
ncbi:MAG: LTA synthase family protein [Clostridia bacterium]|nr:LTA synthase family protein [Clostridia bacterium]